MLNKFKARKLGQVFLISRDIASSEAEHAPGKTVLEIGPGHGILTMELCIRAKKVIAVEDQSGEELSLKQLHEVCESSYSDFGEKFMVYRKLREDGFVVTPGIKFGSDFAVYEHGPGIDHAPYIVQVASPDSKMTATSMVRSGRLATTVRKQFIIAIPDEDKKSIEFLRYDWWRA